jgi:hypothetical protein
MMRVAVRSIMRNAMRLEYLPFTLLIVLSIISLLSRLILLLP